MNTKLIKVLGVVVSIAGAGLSILGNWVSEKQQDAKIAEKVTEAITNMTNGEA